MSATNAPPSQESGADRVQVQSGTGAELVFLVKDGVPSERCIQRGCRAQAAAEEYPAGRQRGGGVCVWGGEAGHRGGGPSRSSGLSSKKEPCAVNTSGLATRKFR